ncbi:hypothetical protein NEOC65_002095 [Neochlamydia sp. AcF65]|nr:hypothetical protein [Neochlamydia sp. AcF65]MBS4170410.1 hypothetical protein [Neochlamydia sp. AcF95]NGY95376.1 hypothetical protein [Neochlamydia sp. AcF84]
MTIPFKAKCIQLASKSPLKIDEISAIIGMGDGENCEYDRFAQVKWKDKETLCVPLKQMKGINVGNKIK